MPAKPGSRSPLDGVHLGPPVLVVRDLTRATEFARVVLGFEIAEQDSAGTVLTMGDAMVLLVTVESGETLLGGRRPGSGDSAHPPLVMNIFVEDVEGALENARLHGAEVLVEVMDRPWGRRTAHILDPDGYVWEFSRALTP